MGRMEMTYCSVSATDPNAEEILEILKDTGATSIQTYIYWNQVEQKRGSLDWSKYDRDLELFLKHDLKWVPFLITGPWYVTPKFVRQDPKITFYRCLEHGRESKIPSLWCPVFRDYIKEYLGDFAAHYGTGDVLESVNCGITGDYGEAIYPVMGNWPGEYHTHEGFWCGDKLAVESFRAYVFRLSGGQLEKLNARWQTSYASFEEVVPTFQPLSKRQLADTVQWYRGEMNFYADFWLGELGQYLPETELYLCTGGIMTPQHGSDFAAQCKLAAKRGCGIRITNEASDYPFNNAITRLVSSAARFYGCFYGNEPAARVTAPGTLGRLYNAVAGGAKQLFLYMNAHISTKEGVTISEAGKLLKEHRDFLEETIPLVETALLFPTSQSALGGVEEINQVAAGLRQYLDFDFVDENMLSDGALARYKLLVIAQTDFLEEESMLSIKNFVESGGLLIVLGSKPKAPEGRVNWFDEFLGFTAQSQHAVGHSSGGWVAPSLPTIAEKLKGMVFRESYCCLSPQIEPLIKMAYADSLVAAWRLFQAQGMVYCYYGPMPLRENLYDWAEFAPYPILFMKDAVEAASSEGVLPTLPASLNTEPHIYLTNTTAGILALNLNEEGKLAKIGEREHKLPPVSITLIGES